MPLSFPAAPVIVALGLAGLFGCREPAPYDLRRVPVDGQPSQLLTAGGVTRPGLRLEAATKVIGADLADLTAGRVTVHAAPAAGSPGPGTLVVELRETGWRRWTGTGFRERCVLHWGPPGTPADVPWQPCAFELPRNVASARLELVRRSRADGDVYVSELRIEGQSPRKLTNVFVLLLDAVRFDGLRPFRADAQVGSNVEALARDSVVFRNLRSSSSWTRPAVATLFTGLRSDRHRVLDRGDVLPDEALTLAEILKDRGYSTASWSTNPNVLPVWGLAQGFDVFVDQGSHSWSWGKTDGSAVVSVLRSALSSRGAEPLFYYAHFMDPHAPYRPSKLQLEAVEALPGMKAAFPRPLAILTSHDDWRAFLDYTGELLDTDDHVGAFVGALKEAGLYEDALVLVLADHGEEFIDHGGRDHGRTLYDEVLHVPALLKLPGNRHAGRSVTTSLSMVDVFPTLLAALGLDVPSGLDGTVIDLEDATEPATRPTVAALRLDGRRFSSIFDPPWKLIRNDATGGLELYNIAEDPKERKNHVLWYPDVVTKLAGTLDLMMSHGQEGWHVLLCGSLVETSMDLVATVSSGTLQPFGFQQGEATPGDDERTWRLTPTLTPVEVERPAFGKLTKVVVPEQLEVRVTPSETAGGSTLTLRSGSDEPLRIRAGADVEPRAATEVTLDSSSAELATVQGRRIECMPAPRPGVAPEVETEPFVRVWYVPPTRKIAVESLDQGMQDRLRALGYLQ